MAQYLIRPESDTATVDWTPSGGGSNWTKVDETEVNDDTDYNSTSTMGNIDRLQGQNSLIPTGATITSVKIHAIIKKVPAQAVNVNLSFIAGSDNGFSGDFALTTSYAQYTYDISGLRSWVAADFDGSGSSVEFGYRHNQTQSREARVTQIWVEIKYTPLVKTREPGTMANDASIGTVAWTSPGQGSGSDDTYATASLVSNSSQYLKGTNFGFDTTDAPDASTVVGIEVRIERSKAGTAATVTDNSVKIVKAGTISGDEKMSVYKYQTQDNGETGNAPVTFDEKYGGPTDLWGLSWNPSDLRATGFGVVISSAAPSGTETAQVDNIEITVYLTADGFDGHVMIY